MSGHPVDGTTRLSIVIANWNTREMLAQCLARLPAATSDIQYEVIVVDNGSSDGSVKMLREGFPAVKVIQNSDNVGFPKAVNQGISLSRGRFIALINSDIMVSSGSLGQIVAYLEKNPLVAAAAPQLVGRWGHMQYSGGYAPSPRSGLMQLVEVQALAGGRSHGLFVRAKFSSKPQPVDWLCAACMVVRRRAVENVGGFDDSHFMYAEDLEYGLRLRHKGWQMHLLPWVQVVHYGGASSEGAPEMKLMWLGGVFRVAAANLSRPSYFTFGVLLSASYATRYGMVRALRAAPFLRRIVHSEVAHVEDMRLYAKAAFRLAVKPPNQATVFCEQLEKGYRGL
ncbi:MAG: glycosyltransferase family 2 protein [Thermoleophilia bacterium]